MNATATPNHTPNGMTPPLLTAAELVKGMPEAFRTAVLCELIRNVSAHRQYTGVVPVRDTNDCWIANIVLPQTPGAKADQIYFELDSAHREALLKGYIDLDLDDTYTPEEMTALITAEAGLRTG